MNSCGYEPYGWTRYILMVYEAICLLCCLLLIFTFEYVLLKGKSITRTLLNTVSTIHLLNSKITLNKIGYKYNLIGLLM